MSQEIQLRSSQNLPDVADPLSAYGGAEMQQENLLVKVHRLLRGRYLWAILLAVVFGGGAAAAAYKLVQDTYVSQGLVFVRSSITPIISKTFENQELPFVDQFIQSQITLIKDQRVIERARELPAWKAIGRPNTDEDLAEFMESLTVTQPLRSQMIVVTFTDSDPRATKAAVESVLNAYSELHIENEVRTEEQKRQKLDELRLQANDALRRTQEQIDRITRDYNTDALRELHRAKMEELLRLEAALGDIELVIMGMGVDPRNPAAQPAAANGAATTQPAVEELSPSAIAMRDVGMRQLQAELRMREMEMASPQMSNLGANHPKRLNQQALIDAKRKEIEEYTKLYNEMLRTTLSAPGGMQTAGAAGLTLPQLRLRQQRYQELISKVRAEASDLGTKTLQLEKLQRDRAEQEKEVEIIRDRIKQLDVEGLREDRLGRVQIVNKGTRPMLAKSKRIQKTAAAGVGGAGLGVGLVLLYALADRRFRSPDDVANTASRLALLGVLPSLPDDLSDPEQAAIAAHCVHQIRALLQIGPGGMPRQVFAITSPAAGTGKTSLALSLGVSFAAANSRTLLIDCDIIGGGLTSRVDSIIRRKIGQILRAMGLISQQQLEVAMRMAQSAQKRLGEMLVELGYLSPADVSRALTIQEESTVGLLDALSGEKLEECIAETGIQGLSILPLGSAMPSDVSRLSPASVRKLLDKAREHYDTILVDTGPVPGSLEASVVSAAADGVILVVSRGEHRPLAERSIQYLREIGASVAGMVFNRAENRDMESSATTARLSSFERITGRGSMPTADVAAATDSPKFGPMARAVATGGTTAAKESRNE